jgi:hypothetical protein
MIVQADLHEGQRFLEPFRHLNVGSAWFQIAAGMIVGYYNRSAIATKNLFHDLSDMNRRAIDAAPEHFGIFDKIILQIQKDNRKHLMIETSELVLQVSVHGSARAEMLAALHFEVDGLARNIDDHVGSGGAIVAVSITDHEPGTIRSSQGHNEPPAIGYHRPGAISW